MAQQGRPCLDNALLTSDIVHQQGVKVTQETPLHGKTRGALWHLQVAVAADLHKEVRQHRPDAVPYQPAPQHQVIFSEGAF